MKDLWISVSGAIAQQKKVDTIANNVANANTVGFKKDELAFKEYMTALEKGHTDLDLPNKEWRPEDFYKSYGAEHAKVETSGTYTIFEQGNLTPTQNPYDLAINGKGFFQVETPLGVAYTRRGDFTRNQEGFLVNSSGAFLLARPDQDAFQNTSQETPQRIRIENGRPTITKNGEIFVKGEKVAQLAIFDFKDPHALRKKEAGLFLSSHPENRVLSNAGVHQGFLEESNVNAIEEMSKLIKAHRHFESIKNVIKTYDDIAGRTASDILKF